MTVSKDELIRELVMDGLSERSARLLAESLAGSPKAPNSWGYAGLSGGHIAPVDPWPIVGVNSNAYGPDISLSGNRVHLLTDGLYQVSLDLAIGVATAPGQVGVGFANDISVTMPDGEDTMAHAIDRGVYLTVGAYDNPQLFWPAFIATAGSSFAMNIQQVPSGMHINNSTLNVVRLA